MRTTRRRFLAGILAAPFIPLIAKIPGRTKPVPGPALTLEKLRKVREIMLTAPVVDDTYPLYAVIADKDGQTRVERFDPNGEIKVPKGETFKGIQYTSWDPADTTLDIGLS